MTMSLLPCCFILSLMMPASTAAPSDTAISYVGYRVVRITPATAAELATLQSILNRPPFAAVDIWLDPSQPGRPVDVNVSPQMQPPFLATLTSAKLPYSVVLDDVQTQINREKASIQAVQPQATSVVGSYATYANMLTWLSSLASTNAKVTVKSYGKSLENRTLTVAKISKTPGTPKPIVFIEAGSHAREWISSAAAIWMINQLATSTAADVVALLNVSDWYIVPETNPDGYEYARLTDRLWRKNRAVNKGSTCRGVDLNRNWDAHWMLVGASNNPCDEDFAGPAAFSEPETKELSNFILGIKSNIKAFFSLHAYSQLWLTPWAYTLTPPADNVTLTNVANQGAKALKAVNGTIYRVGSPPAILCTLMHLLFILLMCRFISDAAAGCSYDWAKEKAGIKYSYTLEMRDTGTLGFVLPVSQIVPSGTETLAGIKAAAKLILGL